MSNSNAHNHFPLPTLVLGGGAGRLKGGRHIKYPDHTPMTNLLLTLLDKAGVPMESLGDSTGEMPRCKEARMRLLGDHFVLVSVAAPARLAKR